LFGRPDLLVLGRIVDRSVSASQTRKPKKTMKRLTFPLLAAVATLTALPSNANLLTNPGFEATDALGGDVAGAAGWFGFNFNYTTISVAPHSGNNTLKQFGPFNSWWDASGVGQNFPVSAGDFVTFSAWARNDSSDPIQPGANGGNFAVIKLEFLDSGNVNIGNFETQAANWLTPQNVWNQAIVTATAPAGAASFNALLLHVTDGSFAGGSVFWDDASVLVSAVPEPSSVTLAGVGAGLLMLIRRRI
jgi:hypothetical protein